jgi:hypothetical protein
VQIFIMYIKEQMSVFLHNRVADTVDR